MKLGTLIKIIPIIRLYKKLKAKLFNLHIYEG
jgi:hypothetical protein